MLVVGVKYNALLYTCNGLTLSQSDYTMQIDAYRGQISVDWDNPRPKIQYFSRNSKIHDVTYGSGGLEMDNQSNSFRHLLHPTERFKPVQEVIQKKLVNTVVIL